LSRNFDGYLLEAFSCNKKDLVESDFMAWHTTYKLTDLGVMLVQKYLKK